MTSILTFLREPRARIASLAGLTLLLELALIRWMASNVFHLGFFANFILIACFLGIGLGFLLARRSWDLFAISPLPLFGVMALTLLARVELAVPSAGDVIFVGLFAQEEAQIIPAPLFLFLAFCGIVAAFACISQETARSFPKLEPLTAYTWDILGSLLGIVLFTVMSALWFPSVAWFAVGAVVWVLLLITSEHATKRRTRTAAVAIAATVALSSNPDTLIHAARVVWSPYQMLTAVESPHSAEEMEVFANRIHHQTIKPLHMKEIFRTAPYEVAEREGWEIDRALIVGAGSGVDVAVAVDEGVDHIDAAELDPAIADLAREFNPDEPYQAPSVNLIVNDGRHVIEQATEPYDLIVFALPDSLALYSSQSSVRLESFLFTEESFRGAKAALSENGIFALYNFYWNPAIVDRIAATLEKVFGHPPLVRILDDRFFAVLLIGPNLEGPPLQFDDPAKVEELPTDDWPFLYLMDRKIPTLYVVPLLLLLLFSGLAVFFLVPRGEASAGFVKWPLFFMGSAFLLLETKSIIQFSLLFGATWLVNSLVFAGVLVMVLIANVLVAKRPPKHLWPWYIALGVALFAGWYVPWGSFMSIESTALRYLAATTVLFLPIMIANVIFAGTFRMAESSDVAFGWNLLGTMVGGTAEYSSMVFGYRNLAILVAILYGLALVTFIIAKRRSGGDD